MKKRLVGVLGTLTLATTAIAVATPNQVVLADPIDEPTDAPMASASAPGGAGAPVTPSASPLAALAAPTHPTEAPDRRQPALEPQVEVRPEPTATPKPTVRPQPVQKPAPKAQKPAPKATAKPAPRPVAKPAPTSRPAARVPSVAEARSYAAQRVGSAQFKCLDRLWQKESDWNPKARNPSSGAYGIPQALPATKLASAGSDWRTNPVTQVKWGLGYIDNRYGSPCAAWRHSQDHNWY